MTWVFAENYAVLGFLESAGLGEDMADACSTWPSDPDGQADDGTSA
ncbi:hypothetical protein [Nonomuraea dietziae]